ncbi:hypothetical protein ACFV0C_22525 [Streptomyces sp. NPDC059568]|uniref:hypothetical protein n=1 Tax=Streptomyces sp. NPDC059568 TaxID=3346868 RepID=UPI0036A716E5
MTVQQTTSELPVTLADPTRPPRPAPGCDVCAALDKQRARAEKAGNVKLATTCEIEIRSHSEHGASQP